jgi:hypothetical protein
LTKDESSVQTLPGAGKKFTITGELKPFGKSDDGEFIDSRTWNNEIQIKVTIKRPTAGFDDYFWSAERVAVSLNPYVGKNITLDLVADQVKEGKPQDEKYWNYYCLAVGRHEATAQDVQPAQAVQTPDQPPAPTEPAIPGFNPLPFPEVEGVVQGAMEKLATEIYLATEAANFGEECVWTEIISDIRRLRDQLYHELKSHRPAPPHYCYDHEKSRGKSQKTGAWAHPMTNGGWCIEGEGITVAPAPIEPSDPNSIGTVQIGADGARHPAGCNCQECWPVPDLSPDAFLARMEPPEPPPPLESQPVESLFDAGGNPHDSF